MARHVFSNHDVAYNWAYQHVSHGRSHNGNFSFEGPLLYSYSTCIGNILQGPHGKVWLLDSNHYSVTTTGKHLGPAAQQVYHQRYYFRVPNVTLHGSAHTANLAHLIDNYNKWLGRIMRQLTFLESRSEWSFSSLRNDADKIMHYAEAFDLPAPPIDVDADIDVVLAHHAKRKAWSESPRGIKSREYGRMYRKWRELVKYAERRLRRYNSDDMQDVRSELGIMYWWTTHSGDPDDLAVIKWRFRREE